MAAKTARPRPRPQANRRSARQEEEEPEALVADAVDVVVEDLASFSDRTSRNIIIFGPSGHGKTVLAGGAPNAYFLSTEAGAVAAKRAGSQAKLIRTPTWEHVEAGLNWADKNLTPENWLIVDSATKMQRLLLDWILRANNKRNPKRDLDIPAVKDHQKWQNMFLRFIGRLVDAPYNTIMIATAMYKEDEEDEPLVMPNILGKDYTISQNFCAEADMVLYYAVSKTASTDEEIVRRVLAQPYPPYYAKDRFDCLGHYYDVKEGEYGAMADIISRIEQSLSDEGADEVTAGEVSPTQLHRPAERRRKAGTHKQRSDVHERRVHRARERAS